ncbi:MAG: hypothetical protein LBU56_04695 [Rickettsiales bacterium]|jgi:hypothetical protein|nr:hypothetical protein [Rickettsiales bacterium]
MKFSQEDRDTFNKFFAEVLNSSSKNTSKKTRKGKEMQKKSQIAKK